MIWININLVPYITIFGFIFGSLLGSLAKALADRSLSGKTFWGRSFCPHCKKTLKWYDLFPILSFISLKGKCRYCHKKITIDYLLVELVLGILIAFLFWEYAAILPQITDYFQLILVGSELVFKIIFITALIILSVTDLKETLIPDRIVLPSIVILFFLFLGITVYKIGLLYYSLSQTDFGRLLLPPHNDYFQRHAFLAIQPLIGGVVSGLLIAGFFMGLITVTRGKGMGGGDVKLGMLMGLGLGFPNSLIAVILSFLFGAILALILIALKKKHFGQSLPFGPFLVMGSLIALFWGNQITEWYLHLTI